MRIQPKLTTVVFIAALAISHIVFAEDAALSTPEIAICEVAPEIAVCPEPSIFPEAPEICILPVPIEREDPADRIHIDPIVEEVIEPVVGPEADSVADPEADAPTDNEVSDGSGEKDSEKEVVDSRDPSDEVVTTLGTEDEPSVDQTENEVPIGWYKRDDENFPVFYTTRGNPVAELGNPVAELGNPAAELGNPAAALDKAETPNALAREFGQDDKVAAINTKANATSPKILSEKKEPVALIKKGRVFLR